MSSGLKAWLPLEIFGRYPIAAKTCGVIAKFWHDALHTLDLPDANRTSDARINEPSVAEQRIVVTKDTDFVNSFLISQVPYKLLLVSTGTIANSRLLTLFEDNLSAIATSFTAGDFVEITRSQLIEHK